VTVTDQERYLSLYRLAGSKAARGDASVSTLYYPEHSLSRLQGSFPDARLIVMLREPAARAFSAYSYQRARGFEPCADVREALEKEQERIQLGWHHIWHYVGMGRYARQLAPFLEAVGPERVKVLFYEDLSRDPFAVARQVFEFLAIDRNVAVQLDHVNVSGNPRSRLLQQAIRWAGRRPRLKDATKAVMPFRMRERVRRANLRHGEIPDDAQDILRSTFTTEVSDLRALLAKHYPDLLSSAPPWLANGAAVNGATTP